ncbi:HlyC/CorC family transporter [Alkalilimnicola sp. S0819]|uniref:HlyC/CorC family transporter n=1 Tax=Alkalilimnicola sp. S0819 TaxID=2613922 RepID=UPI0012617382|nr:HlyC/CorC family transporter [Alkalilimnicola sp. S0819]KAB7622569.1 HlyC/CorC family transporter [Alkalilimnicola sp. S0819]MPQ17456.1 DUF21 domain-containing protein [Alkalilimnicola sp. S0819]
MQDIPLSILFAALGALLLLSAAFSGSETALMTLNRYRLKHLVKQGHRGARVANALLERPDRLIGVILLGNNFVNVAASSLATIIAMRLGGEGAIAIAAGILTLAILVFSEVTPKTLAALHPERLAFPASYVLALLLRVLYPLVWAVNGVANGLLRLVGVRADEIAGQALSREELRTVVNEAGALIPRRHQAMLINLLDLEEVTVEDIMVPRNEIVGIDLTDDWGKILEQLSTSQHTRLPVYNGTIDQVQGLIHARRIMRVLAEGELTREHLLAGLREPYFIPENTPLHTQLLNFQRERRRIGLVVDEYGDILGLVTLEDILEEVVGEFTTDPAAANKDIERQPDGSHLVEGSASLRELGRVLKWELPTDGPKTLNGLILEHMENIPEPGTSLMLYGRPVTIVQLKGNKVKTALVMPPWGRKP